MNETDYTSGSRAAWLAMLHTCLRELGVDDPVAGQARWVSEREQTVAMLRQVCERYGDNDWSDTLHLADVVDKHLGKYLEADTHREKRLVDTLTSSVFTEYAVACTNYVNRVKGD